MQAPITSAIYPGTFDPVTYGHLDIIKRASKIVDHLIIAVAKDNTKNTVFSVEDRSAFIKKDLKNMKGVGNASIEVHGFEGLLVNFAKTHQVQIIIRGLRAVSDFEYEFQMSGMNSKLAAEIQTIFLPASESTHFIASRFVKEIARLGGSVEGLVSDNVAQELKAFYQKNR